MKFSIGSEWEEGIRFFGNERASAYMRVTAICINNLWAIIKVVNRSHSHIKVLCTAFFQESAYPSFHTLTRYGTL